MSSSFSSAGSRESKPWRRMTWQVVHAACFSQACSMSMSLSSRLSQIDLPFSASISAPFGQTVACGSTLILGIRASRFSSRQRAPDALVHAPLGERLGGAVEPIHGLLDPPMIGAGERLLQRRHRLVDRGAILRG